MSEYEQLTELLYDVGLSEAAARERLADGDLWVIPPSMRWGGRTPAETLRGLEEAAAAFEGVAEMFASMGAEAAWCFAEDARERAQIAAERARRRLEEN